MVLKKKTCVSLLALALICVSSNVASAQDGVITLDDTVIKGRIQKPEAFYILQNANLSYEVLDVKPSFLEELVKTVEEQPF